MTMRIISDGIECSNTEMKTVKMSVNNKIVTKITSRYEEEKHFTNVSWYMRSQILLAKLGGGQEVELKVRMLWLNNSEVRLPELVVENLAQNLGYAQAGKPKVGYYSECYWSAAPMSKHLNNLSSYKAASGAVPRNRTSPIPSTAKADKRI